MKHYSSLVLACGSALAETASHRRNADQGTATVERATVLPRKPFMVLHTGSSLGAWSARRPFVRRTSFATG